MTSTMTFKESIIYLQSQGCSYHFMFEYFKWVVTRGLSEAEFSAQLIQQLVSEVVVFVENRRIKVPKLDQLMLAYHIDLPKVKALADQSFMIGDLVYPSKWLQLTQPPLLIFYDGDLNSLKKPAISIVGTRAISPYGREVVDQLVTKFVEKDWLSVSGLAKGVDTAVHLKASQLKLGSTVGILANGFQFVYPFENANLQARMSREQLLLSEYLPYEKAQPHKFVMRNRLVAGLSSATIVIEAAKDSGSLITANYALQNNREVFVLPGRITDLQAYGCNSLLQVGASPIISIEECVAELEALLINIGVI